MKLQQHLPNAQIDVEDLTGTQDHYRVVVVSDMFSGKSLLQRHQLINDILKEELKGPIHALSIQANTNEEWKSKQQALPTSKPKGISL